MDAAWRKSLLDGAAVWVPKHQSRRGQTQGQPKVPLAPSMKNSPARATLRGDCWSRILGPRDDRLKVVLTRVDVDVFQCTKKRGCALTVEMIQRQANCVLTLTRWATQHSATQWHDGESLLSYNPWLLAS